jgi:hypothetical protein
MTTYRLNFQNITRAILTVMAVIGFAALMIWTPAKGDGWLLVVGLLCWFAFLAYTICHYIYGSGSTMIRTLQKVVVKTFLIEE